MAVSKRLRYEILRRDNHTCRYCGQAAPDVKLTVDHVTPTTLGGSDDPPNLVAACIDCNSGKSATPPGAPLVDDVAADALRWARAISAAAEAARRKRQYLNDMEDVFRDLWLIRYSESFLPEPWRPSIDDFLAAGLDHHQMWDAIEITAQHYRQDPWRYFCGVCWRKVTDLQAAARALLAAEER